MGEKKNCLQHESNFQTLQRAFLSGDVCLMDCIEKSTGEHVAVICVCVYDHETKEYVFTPFAKFFNGNPFELLIPPAEYKINGSHQ